jgi:hypothetical protein
MLYNLKIYFLGITGIIYSSIILCSLYNKLNSNYCNTCIKFNDNIKTIETYDTNIFHNSINNDKNIIDEINRINKKILDDHKRIINNLHKKILDDHKKLINDHHKKLINDNHKT